MCVRARVNRYLRERGLCFPRRRWLFLFALNSFPELPLQAAATVPGSFNDVIVGSNFDGDLEVRGSPYATFCPYGFMAAPGWDAVSGLGSPNYAILKEYVLSLP